MSDIKTICFEMLKRERQRNTVPKTLRIVAGVFLSFFLSSGRGEAIEPEEERCGLFCCFKGKGKASSALNTLRIPLLPRKPSPPTRGKISYKAVPTEDPDKGGLDPLGD